MRTKLLLRRKVRPLVLEAVSQCGRDNLENVMSTIKESLTVGEARQVREFLRWAFFDWDSRGFGPGNLVMRSG